MASSSNQALSPCVAHLLAMPGGRRLLLNSRSARLTALPEVRNRIYHFATKDTLSFKPLYECEDENPRRLACVSKGAQWSPYQWTVSRRSYLGLTQTCRQLRKEFFPIHQALIPVVILFDELLDYLKTFTVDVKVAIVEVQIPRRCNTNIRDIILLCAEAPGVKLDFGGYAGVAMQAFLENLHEYQEFCNYVREKALRVVTIAENSPCLWTGKMLVSVDQVNVYIRHEDGEPWMDEPYWQGHKKELDTWRLGLGLDGLPVYPCLGRAEESSTEAIWEDFRTWSMQKRFNF